MFKELDEHVTILGFYAENNLIILLEQPYDENKAIVLTESCLTSLLNHS